MKVKKKIPIIPIYPKFNFRNSFSKIFEKITPYPIADEMNTSVRSCKSLIKQRLIYKSKNEK